jgi:hypothetical protein
MLQHTFTAGFIAPCLPTKTDKLPSGDLWLHEIKHDGFRVIASSYHQRGGNTSMDVRSLIVLVAALLLFLVIVGFIVAYLFQPIPVQ